MNVWVCVVNIKFDLLCSKALPELWDGGGGIVHRSSNKSQINIIAVAGGANIITRKD